MATWAILDDGGHVTDTVTVDPKTIRHPDLAKHYVSVADTVKRGDIKGGDGKYTTPSSSETASTELSRLLDKANFFICMTVAERKAILAAEKTDTTVEDFIDWFTYGQHNTLAADVKADIDYFVTKSYISSATADKIKAVGAPPVVE